MANRYARVDESGKIAEYPVLEQHIAARGHPLSWYVLVEVKTPPACPAYHRLEENLYFQGSVLVSEMAVVALGFDEILSGYVYPDGDRAAPINIQNLDSSLIDALMTAGKKIIQEKLDKYAASQGYDNIFTMCSYEGDIDQTYSSQGAAAKALRSLTWRALFNYFAAIADGTNPPPKYFSDVQALLPEQIRDL